MSFDWNCTAQRAQRHLISFFNFCAHQCTVKVVTGHSKLKQLLSIVKRKRINTKIGVIVQHSLATRYWSTCCSPRMNFDNKISWLNKANGKQHSIHFFPISFSLSLPPFTPINRRRNGIGKCAMVGWKFVEEFCSNQRNQGFDSRITWKCNCVCLSFIVRSLFVFFQIELVRKRWISTINAKMG